MKETGIALHSVFSTSTPSSLQQWKSPFLSPTASHISCPFPQLMRLNNEAACKHLSLLLPNPMHHFSSLSQHLPKPPSHPPTTSLSRLPLLLPYFVAICFSTFHVPSLIFIISPLLLPPPTSVSPAAFLFSLLSSSEPVRVLSLLSHPSSCQRPDLEADSFMTGSPFKVAASSKGSAGLYGISFFPLLPKNWINCQNLMLYTMLMFIFWNITSIYHHTLFILSLNGCFEMPSAYIGKTHISLDTVANIWFYISLTMISCLEAVSGKTSGWSALHRWVWAIRDKGGRKIETNGESNRMREEKEGYAIFPTSSYKHLLSLTSCHKTLLMTSKQQERDMLIEFSISSCD